MGFLATSFRAFALSYVNHYMVHRGPDGTVQERHVEPLYTTDFVHNLLHSGGVREQQPFRSADNKTWALLDGTLYNGASFGALPRMDAGRAVLAAYEKHGERYGAHLEGEFAAVVVDFARGRAVAAADAFGTKNLWVGVDSGEWCLSSCESPLSRLGVRRDHRKLLAANSAVVIQIAGRASIIEQIPGLRSFAPALAATADADEPADGGAAAVAAWGAAFDAAVKRRLPAREKRRASVVLAFASLGLRTSEAREGGGTLVCSLAVSDAAHSLTLVHRSAESNAAAALSEERVAFAQNNGQLRRGRSVREGGAQWSGEHAHLFQRMPETLLLGAKDGMGAHDLPVAAEAVPEPDAASGSDLDIRMQRESAVLSKVFGQARQDRAFVYLSSLGAPNIGGGLLRTTTSGVLEPLPLQLRGQLMQDNLVAGTHGIEIRYPFLDPAVVEAFMNLPRAMREAAAGSEESVLRKYMRAQRCPVDPSAPAKDEL